MYFRTMFGDKLNQFYATIKDVLANFSLELIELQVHLVAMHDNVQINFIL